ncbi:hypothetical protein ACT6MO_003861, partial [Escherichia coli]
IYTANLVPDFFVVTTPSATGPGLSSVPFVKVLIRFISSLSPQKGNISEPPHLAQWPRFYTN